MTFKPECERRCPVLRNTRTSIEKFTAQRVAATSYERARLDRLINRGNQFLGELAVGCTEKPLTMRAPNGDTLYTTTVCTSKGVPTETLPNEIYEPVTIIRSPLPQSSEQ